MPLFRWINPPPGLEDATYLHDTNPDPERFTEVAESPEAPADPAPAVEPPAQSVPTETEES